MEYKNSANSLLDSPAAEKLCCPITRQPLHESNGGLSNLDNTNHYRVTKSGVALFAESLCSEDAARQRTHYNKVAKQYSENLGYPHTQEYMSYLDRVFVEQVDPDGPKEVAEICCGQGELLSLLPSGIDFGIGVDISQSMLEMAQSKHEQHKYFLYVQGDATQMPLQDKSFDSVFIFGGIHHVPDRQKLFDEIFRILKPSGKFYFREPVSDFILWRIIRTAVYKLSPALDAETERPLLWQETVPLLEKSGFSLKTWNTYGFLGFCFFMNSDVLIFNRIFRFIPGIRKITHVATLLDDLTLKIPGLSKAGLQVVGVAEKPEVREK